MAARADQGILEQNLPNVARRGDQARGANEETGGEKDHRDPLSVDMATPMGIAGSEHGADRENTASQT